MMAVTLKHLMFFISDINYFHCQTIIELLKDTESGKQKNIFGQYSSQKMKVRRDYYTINFVTKYIGQPQLKANN